ncbi:MAG: serine/threonine protein phosphatase [Planctomycetota bacterium]|nr:serine/threonine protein phosphatase [Planctomycetota bacterium]
MSWYDWIRNLWRNDTSDSGLPMRRLDPESTQDYSTPPDGNVAPTTHSTGGAGGFPLRVGVVSTTGNVREHNEDNFYVPGRQSLNNDVEIRAGASPRKDDTFSSGITADFAMPGPPGLFIVADGMGGQLAGEKASQMAVELIPREVAKRLGPDLDEKAMQRAVRDSIAKANDEILALSHMGTEFANMGTTVVLALFQGDRAYVAGIGDSRAYRLRGEKLEQLTRDHSLANALGEAGTIRPEEVETHKFKHVLYLYLGSKDARDGPEEVRVVDLKRGDQFLLASDGLNGVVRDEMIAEILRSYDDPQKAAQALVERALELRSKDNITAVVIHLN